MASSFFASNSQYFPQWKYDVFLSFRGKDTRRNFTSHLYEGLRNRGIFTFQDDKRLEQGDSIPEELLKAIIESQVALVVFSNNYAASRWCLNELVKIMDCKDEYGQTVIPIFYDVDPSKVRNQSENFAEAFVKHESKYKDDVEGMKKVQGWRTALTDAANLKGYDIRDGIESENIQQIVDHVSSKLCKSAYSSSSLQDVVGINAHLEKLKSQLQIEINDVRILGIWGIGGVGKTTIAKAIFDTLSYQFNAVSFLVDVKDNAKKHQLHSLQNILLSELLRKKDDYVNNKYDGKSMLSRRLCSKKVLIVLDDIDHSDHLEYLAGDVCWFGNGSRVIVTTRNRHLIGKDDAIYKVSTLPDHEAMQLFNQHAFKKEVPNECFKKFSLEVINHAKGLPLALKVWGSLLHKKDLTQWRITVDQIKKKSNSEIVNQLKISYDGLEAEEQKIFLDIACFFRGDQKERVMPILESCDFGAEYGLSVLIDKSLVFISENGLIEMHDLIQNMGKYVVKMQKDSEECSRLWDADDFEEVVVNNIGTKAVEVIWLQEIQNLFFRKKIIKNMKRLRILHIEHFHTHDDSIEYLPNNLRWLAIHAYPWESLSGTFEPKRLVHLNLEQSSLRHLWVGIKQHLPSLRKLNLSCSDNLMRTPDFTEMPNLEYLNLEHCMNLEEVHHSLGCCGKLIELQLSWCVNLKRFPCLNMDSLGSVYLQYCYKLERFPEILGRMKLDLEIYIGNSGIRELPSSIQYQTHITKLHFGWLKNLVALPSCIGMLKSLVNLDVCNCFKLESLPEEIGDLEKLELLDATCTLIYRPPSSIVRLKNLKFLTFEKNKSEVGLEDGRFFLFPEVNEGLRSLEYLNLKYCNLIDGGLPEDIGSLSSLETLYLRGNNFDHLPQSIAQLGALQHLDLSDCKRLKEFRGVCGEYLDLEGCSSIERFPETFVRMKLEMNSGIRELPSSIQYITHITNLYLKHMKNLVALPNSIGMLKSLVKLDVSYCSKLDSFPETIGDLENLMHLDARDTLISQPPSSIVRLNKLEFLSFAKQKSEAYFVFPPVAEGLHSLEILNLSYCNLIDGGLPEDIGCLSSLESLILKGNNFEHLPRSIAQLGKLQYLYLAKCTSLIQLPELPSDLYELHADCHMVLKSIDHIATKKKNIQRVRFTPLYDKDSIYNLLAHALFQNITSLQHDMSASDSLSQRVFTIEHGGLKYPVHRGRFGKLNTRVSVILPRSIGSLRFLDLSDCKRLTVDEDWSNDLISNSLFQDIPSWLHHQGTGTSVSVNLPKNWYVHDSLLGLAVCYSGSLIETTVQLLPLCDDGISGMAWKLKLSDHSKCYTRSTIHFFLVPLVGLWDTSKANGKTPNDYKLISLTFTGEMKEYGCRLLYKDEPEPEALLQTRENNDEPTEHSVTKEASFC